MRVDLISMHEALTTPTYLENVKKASPPPRGLASLTIDLLDDRIRPAASSVPALVIPDPGFSVAPRISVTLRFSVPLCRSVAMVLQF